MPIWCSNLWYRRSDVLILRANPAPSVCCTNPPCHLYPEPVLSRQPEFCAPICIQSCRANLPVDDLTCRIPCTICMCGYGVSSICVLTTPMLIRYARSRGHLVPWIWCDVWYQSICWIHRVTCTCHLMCQSVYGGSGVQYYGEYLTCHLSC